VSAARRRERAVLVGVSRGRGARAALDEHLDELERLAATAGAAVAGRLIQERGPVSAATLLRSGKAEELKNLCIEHDAALVIFDEDLSPAQVRNLEKETETTVLDRSALILDIFARRARSREARTQVELAQLRYLLPRLTRQWSHLSRQAGGIGHVLITGAQTEYCVDATVRRAASLGYDVTLAADGHTTSASRVLSRDQIVAHHNRTLPGLALVGPRIAARPAAEALTRGR